jgi:hypothetical protein
MTKVSIVILNWNGLNFLEKFLPVLIEKSKGDGVEIIIADNKSSDKSIEFLKKNFSEIRIIELDSNYGFAGGYNKALEQIEAEYYLLLNSDIEVTDNWLEPLIKFMQEHKQFAACAPMLIDYANREKYEYAGAAGGYIDKYGYTFCRGRIFNSVEKVDLSLKKPIEVFWASGASILIRSEIFHENSGFDELFFAHMEEVDLCWRLKNQGYKIAVVPSSKVFHIGGATLPKSDPFKTYLNFRNNLLLLYKNLGDSKLQKILVQRQIMDGLSAILFLLSFKFKDIAAIVKAHRSFRRNLSSYYEFRKNQKIIHNYPDHQEMYQKSVVFDYFLSRRKSFELLRDNFPVLMNKKIID